MSPSSCANATPGSLPFDDVVLTVGSDTRVRVATSYCGWIPLRYIDLELRRQKTAAKASSVIQASRVDIKGLLKSFGNKVGQGQFVTSLLLRCGPPNLFVFGSHPLCQPPLNDCYGGWYRSQREEEKVTNETPDQSNVQLCRGMRCCLLQPAERDNYLTRTSVAWLTHTASCLMTNRPRRRCRLMLCRSSQSMIWMIARPAGSSL